MYVATGRFRIHLVENKGHIKLMDVGCSYFIGYMTFYRDRVCTYIEKRVPLVEEDFVALYSLAPLVRKHFKEEGYV